VGCLGEVGGGGWGGGGGGGGGRGGSCYQIVILTQRYEKDSGKAGKQNSRVQFSGEKMDKTRGDLLEVGETKFDTRGPNTVDGYRAKDCRSRKNFLLYEGRRTYA